VRHQGGKRARRIDLFLFAHLQDAKFVWKSPRGIRARKCKHFHQKRSNGRLRAKLLRIASDTETDRHYGRPDRAEKLF
jgi:hypothetical protein